MSEEVYEFIYRGTRGESSLGFYFSGKQDCAPGHSFGPAVRNQYLLHFVMKGNGTYTVRGKSFALHPGEVFLIYPGDVTVYRADIKNPWSYCWIAFHGSEAEAAMKRCGFTRDCPVAAYAGEKDGKKEYVEGLLSGLLKQAAGKRQGEYALKGWLYLIFDQLEQPERQETDFGRQYVEKAKEYITANFPYDIKIQDVAGYVGIDRTYLYRLFMEYENQPPYSYLLNLRFQEARNMLQYTKMPVTMIACSCGFKDSSAFCRHFKKTYGISPLAYRKSFPARGISV